MGFSCKGCPDRTPGCHGKCEKYQTEKAEHEAMREEMFAQKQIRDGLEDQKHRVVTRAVKRKRYGGVFYGE